MTLSLIATPGATDANTYITLADAETYFEARLHKDDWTGATDANKNAALAWATRILDDMIFWYGWKMDEDQALKWPRGGVYDEDGFAVTSSLIPTFLERATAELALWLIGKDRTADAETIGFSKIAVDVISLDIDKGDRPQVLPDAVWQMVKDYGKKKSGGAFAPVKRA